MVSRSSKTTEIESNVGSCYYLLREDPRRRYARGLRNTASASFSDGANRRLSTAAAPDDPARLLLVHATRWSRRRRYLILLTRA